MTPNLSFYLDALRFLAATTVLLGHLSGQRFTGGWLWQLRPYTHDAVMVFFVLSGFVIGYVTHVREENMLKYGISRLARIYSVALPSLIVTFCLDGVGLWMNAPLYPMLDGGTHFPFANYVGSVIFLNEVWDLDFFPGSNIAYWSLGYECWYYAIFGILLFVRPPWNWLGGALGLALVGPRVASLFPLWCLGVAAYHLCARARIGPRTGIALTFAPALLWFLFELSPVADGQRPGITAAGEVSADFLRDYGIAVAIALHLVGARIFLERIRIGQRMLGVTRFLANRTFSIYILHVPVAQFLLGFSVWQPGSWPGRLFSVCGTIGMIFLFAEITECRKGPWKAMFTRIFRDLPSRPSRTART